MKNRKDKRNEKTVLTDQKNDLNRSEKRSNIRKNIFLNKKIMIKNVKTVVKNKKHVLKIKTVVKKRKPRREHARFDLVVTKPQDVK